MSSFKKIAAIALVLCVLVSAFAACALTPAGKLVGSWRDSTGITGYEFKKDNLCTITYANFSLPIIGTINGNFDGAYSVEKRDDGNNYVTIKYTLYSKTFEECYMFTVDGDTLTLVSVDSGESKTLMAYKPAESTVAQTQGATVAP
ncbi:MAG: hypothetical protein IJ262_03105 [Clostridia bacterium]|nr:hypothetical protein [Clostridia bacterium]